MTNTADPKAKTNKIYIGPASVRTACGGSEDKSATTRFAIRRGDQLATAVGCPRNKSRIRLREDLRSYWPIIRCRRPIFNKTVEQRRFPASPGGTRLYRTKVRASPGVIANFVTAVGACALSITGLTIYRPRAVVTLFGLRLDDVLAVM